MTFRYRHRKEIIIGVISLLIIISIVTTTVISLNSSKKEEKEIKEVKVKKKKVSGNTDSIEKIKVDIKGQINNPGIYELDKDSRVIDVIASAGGLTEHADTSALL